MSEESDHELVKKMRAAHRLATRDSAINEILTREIRKAEESGELRHLYGQPLNLDDDPNWFLKRTLQQAGVGHPLLERVGDLDAMRDAAAQLLERLRERRDRVTRRQEPRDYERRHAFNEERRRVLERYREKLIEVNRGIQNYNLVVPSALYRRPINIDTAVDAAAKSIPPLPMLVPDQPVPAETRRRPRRRFWSWKRSD